jgi:predicted Fe-Mo cluster-binding NifX family protein
MKIAVPLFGDRISPHFGASSEILLVETDGATVSKRSVVRLETTGPGRMARRLASFGVNKLVCNGIQRAHKRWLIDNGIQVTDNQKGPAEERIVEMLSSESDQNDSIEPFEKRR